MRVQRDGVLTFPADTAIDAYLRVVISGGQLAVAGAEDLEIGTMREANVVSGLGATTKAAVVSRNVEGTVRMIAAGAISKFDMVYGADGGMVSATPNNNRIGIAMTATTTAGDYVEVMRVESLTTTGSTSGGSEVGGLILFDDFLGDYPAAATAMASPWTKVETDGLGVTSSDQANGVLKFAFDAVAEAATAALYMVAAPFDVDQNPIFECRAAVYDKGDDAALDINIGLAVDTHATDFDSVAQYVAFHLDGNDLSVKCQSKDGTTTVAATDTGVDLVDDTFAVFRIDCTDKTDVKFYINGTRVLSDTTFTLAAFTGTLTPIVHVEKTSNDTTADVRVDWIRVLAERA